MPKIGLLLPQKTVLGLPNGRNRHLEALFSILFVEHFYANISSFDAKISIGAQGFEDIVFSHPIFDLLTNMRVHTLQSKV